MLREIDLKEISDGRLYNANDMVKADCRGCINCSACCSGMGESIVLDPLDIHNIASKTQLDFSSLLQKYIELNIVDGIALPNLKMNPACGFLNRQGKCEIHNERPGICRLFPLGRVYEKEGFRYFIQVDECPVSNKGKVKVNKWLGIKNIKKYEQYIWDWHVFLKACMEQIPSLSNEQNKILNMLIIRTFYQKEYQQFYEEFYQRLEETKSLLGIS